MKPAVISLSAMLEMDSFSFVASSRISCMISGERVRAIRTLRGLPEGGLAIQESYDANYFNVHLIFHVVIKRESTVR